MVLAVVSFSVVVVVGGGGGGPFPPARQSFVAVPAIAGIPPVRPSCRHRLQCQMLPTIPWNGRGRRTRQPMLLPPCIPRLVRRRYWRQGTREKSPVATSIENEGTYCYQYCFSACKVGCAEIWERNRRRSSFPPSCMPLKARQRNRWYGEKLLEPPSWMYLYRE